MNLWTCTRNNLLYGKIILLWNFSNYWKKLVLWPNNSETLAQIEFWGKIKKTEIPFLEISEPFLGDGDKSGKNRWDKINGNSSRTRSFVVPTVSNANAYYTWKSSVTLISWSDKLRDEEKKHRNGAEKQWKTIFEWCCQNCTLQVRRDNFTQYSFLIFWQHAVRISNSSGKKIYLLRNWFLLWINFAYKCTKNSSTAFFAITLARKIGKLRNDKILTNSGSQRMTEHFWLSLAALLVFNSYSLKFWKLRPNAIDLWGHEKKKSLLFWHFVLTFFIRKEQNIPVVTKFSITFDALCIPQVLLRSIETSSPKIYIFVDKSREIWGKDSSRLSI